MGGALVGRDTLAIMVGIELNNLDGPSGSGKSAQCEQRDKMISAKDERPLTFLADQRDGMGNETVIRIIRLARSKLQVAEITHEMTRKKHFATSKVVKRAVLDTQLLRCRKLPQNARRGSTAGMFRQCTAVIRKPDNHHASSAAGTTAK